MKSIPIKFLVIMLGVLLLVPTGQAKAEKPIVLGCPLSTAFLYGWDAERGIKLAVEEINAAGGVNVGGQKRPFKVEVIDTRDLEPGVPVSEALLALEKLILDGRIHPSRIEELVAQTKKEVDDDIRETGKKVLQELDIHNLNGRLVRLIGRLKYRTSYGQNVLKHSIEVAHLSSALASELRLSSKLAKRCGLLHDIGKALDHELEGGHPAIGADLCKRYGEKPAVVEAVGCHHGDGQANSIFTPIITAADAISASRPGARRETLERYVQRLQKLEEIASDFEGVKQAYAIQAGREVG